MSTSHVTGVSEEVAVLRTIGYLGLTDDFLQTLQEAASQHSSDSPETQAIAEIQQELKQLASEPQLQQPDQVGHAIDRRRVQLAAEARSCKVATRPQATSTAYASGNRHFEVA